jgi:hypothetical protein
MSHDIADTVGGPVLLALPFLIAGLLLAALFGWVT